MKELTGYILLLIVVISGVLVLAHRRTESIYSTPDQVKTAVVSKVDSGGYCVTTRVFFDSQEEAVEFLNQ